VDDPPERNSIIVRPATAVAVVAGVAAAVLWTVLAAGGDVAGQRKR
jgi:hypothetical protein